MRSSKEHLVRLARRYYDWYSYNSWRTFQLSNASSIESVVEMSAERRDNGLGLGVVITAHGGEDGTVMG
jgi:hypothetical protein